MTLQPLPLRLSVLLIITVTTGATRSRPEVMTVTWQVIATDSGKVVNSTSRQTNPGTWWPDLEFDLCTLEGLGDCETPPRTS